MNLALLYEKWDKIDLSMNAINKAILINPYYSNSYIARGERRRKMGLYKEAISDFSIAIMLDSTNKISFNNRGLCKFYIKDYEEAIFDFEKALSINLGESFVENFETDKYSYNNIANSYFGLGNINRACEYWRLALNKGYQYKSEWKELYNIDDPKLLIEKYCK
ncbi:MAG: tetratricopeptide repeat protein [Bacteroidia bacterium]|jgi:pentatricopeptide repeat protein|nr:tetratricopeptide repeat protein [Bacteroidia bacterium]